MRKFLRLRFLYVYRKKNLKITLLRLLLPLVWYIESGIFVMLKEIINVFYYFLTIYQSIL